MVASLVASHYFVCFLLKNVHLKKDEKSFFLFNPMNLLRKLSIFLPN